MFNTKIKSKYINYLKKEKDTKLLLTTVKATKISSTVIIDKL